MRNCRWNSKRIVPACWYRLQDLSEHLVGSLLIVLQRSRLSVLWLRWSKVLWIRNLFWSQVYKGGFSNVLSLWGVIQTHSSIVARTGPRENFIQCCFSVLWFKHPQGSLLPSFQTTPNHNGLLCLPLEGPENLVIERYKARHWGPSRAATRNVWFTEFRRLQQVSALEREKGPIPTIAHTAGQQLEYDGSSGKRGVEDASDD